MNLRRLLLASPVIVTVLTVVIVTLNTRAGPDTSSPYSERLPSRDGIGKLYMGREISQVMGHRGARWLERATRAYEEQPDEVVAHMDLRPDETVADIGAGTGYFSLHQPPGS